MALDPRWFEDRKRVNTISAQQVLVQTDKPVYRAEQTSRRTIGIAPSQYILSSLVVSISLP